MASLGQTQIDRINACFEAGPMPIERKFAETFLSKFLTELDISQNDPSGVRASFRERRRASRPMILSFEGGSILSEEIDSPIINTRQGQIAHLKLNGVMMQEDFLSTQGMQSFAEDIRKADQTPNIAGILIEANTGGGEMLAGQTLRNAIKDAKKPVLVYAHYLASAGIAGTVFATHIMAAGKSSEFGSIGVFAQMSKPFLNAYKENIQAVYSRKSPNKNKEFKALLEGDTSPLEEALTGADDIFMNDVKRNRPLSGDIEETLSGSMFYAAEAKDRGLIDSIGTFSDAVEELQRIIRTKKTSQQMGKFSFINAAKKFLGLEATTEEEAQAALEAAEAVAQTGLDLAVEQMTKDVATLQATVTALKAQTEQLQADFKALQIPPAGASTEEVTAQIQALRAELSTELNALKVKASGDSVAGDDAIRLKTGQDGGNENGKLQVDLLQTVKDAKIKIIPGLA